jgi:hypothetical protein
MDIHYAVSYTLNLTATATAPCAPISVDVARNTRQV